MGLTRGRWTVVAALVSPVALLLAGCGSESTPVATTSADPVKSAVEKAVSGHKGGAVVLIRRGGSTRTVAAGSADNSGRPLKPGDAFRVGSVTKPFIATMVMQMVDEGKVKLDAPISRYLPKAPFGSATVAQLLQHRSGIASYTDLPTFNTNVTRDLARAWTPAEILGTLNGAKGTTPGQFAYSNTNYVLLGMLVEAVDRQPVNASLKKRVFARAGLRHTYLAGASAQDPAPVGAWSEGLLSGDPKAQPTSLITSAWTAGAMVSTPRDLATFVDALAAHRLTTAQSFQKMSQAPVGSHGMGLIRAQVGKSGPGIAHDGVIPGYSSVMARADNGDLVVALTNDDTIDANDVTLAVLAATDTP